MSSAVKKPFGRRVFLSFFAFFAFIALVNAVFIHFALDTHSGVVVENPYKKGLAYNKTLSKAKAQPDLKQSVSFDGGVLSWNLQDERGAAIKDASVRAKLVRPIKEGNDFEVILLPAGEGRYKAKISFPFKGLWTAQLDAQWNDLQYQTSHQIIVR